MAPTRTPDVGPAIGVAAANGNCDLSTPEPLQRWKINAPKMAISVALKCLKNEARRDTVSYPRLDNLLWSQVTRQTPYCSHQSSIAIVPPLIAFRAGPYPLCF